VSVQTHFLSLVPRKLLKEGKVRKPFTLTRYGAFILPIRGEHYCLPADWEVRVWQSICGDIDGDSEESSKDRCEGGLHCDGCFLIGLADGKIVWMKKSCMKFILEGIFDCHEEESN
jgi:hypothetical protein